MSRTHQYEPPTFRELEEWASGGDEDVLDSLELLCHSCKGNVEAFRDPDGTYTCSVCDWLIQCDNCGKPWIDEHLCDGVTEIPEGQVVN